MVVNYFVIYFVLTFILVGFGWSCVAAAGGGGPFLGCPPAERFWQEIRYQSRRSAPAGRLWTENRFFVGALLRPDIPSPEESPNPPLPPKKQARCTEIKRYSGLTIPNMYYHGWMVGPIVNSFTLVSSGWSIAKATTLATRSGLMPYCL